MRLKFHGAAGGITGSHLVLDTGDFRIAVDAGLFRGGDAKRNTPGFGYDPRSLRALLLTHAHITTAVGYLSWSRRASGVRSIRPLPRPTSATYC
jgi:Cft2 family RNA processing exonuclease